LTLDLNRGVHRSRTGPDRIGPAGPRTENLPDLGPRTGPVWSRSWTGPDRTDSRPILEQHCTLIELIEVLNFSGSHG